MPALRLRSGQAPAGIQGSLSLGNLLRTVLRQRAHYAQSSALYGSVEILSPGSGERKLGLKVGAEFILCNGQKGAPS